MLGNFAPTPERRNASAACAPLDINDLEANGSYLEKTTQKWPEPWTDISGMVETRIGKLILPSTKEIAVQYSLWGKMGAVPGEKHSWGGTLIASVVDFIKLSQADKPELVLELSDYRRGKILITGFSGDTGSFSGTGYYPSQE